MRADVIDYRAGLNDTGPANHRWNPEATARYRRLIDLSLGLAARFVVNAAGDVIGLAGKPNAMA